ncbi:hypothetical protein BS50DRAFT_617409 [Corynespora cassiicola Philippines]|uniref:Rhodopsin domain-containing protein n=1 Tax=Corynespora cassiicola Philippines TaxID=1448308 RepID=A0A2T2P372_CORCC|nr:hypothetical protein BS50DRAFT_617409 [Corynespora cassiicola Philippines]
MSYVAFPITKTSKDLFIATCVIHAFIIIIVLLRFASRITLKTKLSWDDVFTALGTITSTIIFALYSYLARSGLGYPPTMTIVNYSFNGKLNLTNEVLYGFGIVCARLSALLLYLRVFVDLRLQAVIKTFMAITVMLLISLTLWDVFICRPVSMNWNLNVEGKCSSRVAPYVTACAIAIVSDLIVLILPMPLIWRLNLRRSNKIGLQCLFTFSLSTVAVVIWRLERIYLSNPLKTRAYIIFTAIAEIDLVLLCGSIPVVYPLVLKYRPKFLKSSSTRSGGSSNLGAKQWKDRAVRTFGSATVRRNNRTFDPLEDSIDYPTAIRLDTLVTIIDEPNPEYREDETRINRTTFQGGNSIREVDEERGSWRQGSENSLVRSKAPLAYPTVS